MFFLLLYSEPAIDENVVRELAAMGFAFEGCKKAVYHTKNAGIHSTYYISPYYTLCTFSEQRQHAS